MSNINNHNHIVIGIGGLSSRIIDMIYEKSQANTVFALDTDVNSLMILKHLPAKNRIALSSISSVKDMLAETGNEDGWFPENELIYNFTLAEGCGLNRPCSMLAFYNVLKRGSLRRFEESLTKILNDAVPFEKVSISVITSLFGSTGAGLFLPFAVYIRQFASSIRSDINIDVRGYFLVSESFMNSMNYSKEIADTQKSMVYACLQEIHSINNGNFEKMNKFFKKFGTTDNDDELPYDYCFFYDHLPENNTNLFAEMIVQQLFSPAAEVVNAKLENSIQISRRRNNVALYANSDVFKICPDKTMPEKFEEMLSDIAIENSIVSCFIPVNQKDKYKVSSRAVHTEYVEDADYISVNRIMTNITLEKFYYCQKDGEYETKYKQRCEREKNNKVFTPHLTCEWDNLPLICDDKVSVKTKPEANQIFISYSSKEYDIALLTKHMLEKNGFSCWLAPESIPGGSNYAMEIPLGISNSFAVVLLLSKNSQESVWVTKEVQQAFDKQKFVVPIQLDEEKISDTFGFLLVNNQRISAINRLADAFEELVAILKKQSEEGKI